MFCRRELQKQPHLDKPSPLSSQPSSGKDSSNSPSQDSSGPAIQLSGHTPQASLPSNPGDSLKRKRAEARAAAQRASLQQPGNLPMRTRARRTHGPSRATGQHRAAPPLAVASATRATRPATAMRPPRVASASRVASLASHSLLLFGLE